MQILTKNQSHGKIIGIFHLHCSQNLTNLESLYFFGFGVFCLGGGGVDEKPSLEAGELHRWKGVASGVFIFYFFYLQRGAATGVGCGNGDKQEP